MERHVEAVLQSPLVDVPAIRACKFKIVVDAVNSTGGIAVPLLLDALGCEVEELYCAPNGQFPHNPEPLKEHLGEICRLVPAVGAHLGIVVDPDVDRLALIDETGEMFGEEYTLVAVADYVLDRTPGPAVSNLSSSRALRDVALGHQCLYRASAVGEVNVVETMKELGAVIGGEGNGGIIYPELHYGRDSLVGIALFLTHLAYQGGTVSALRRGYPAYFMAKKKAELDPAADVDAALARIADRYKEERVTTVDGVKIDFQESWVHLRKSNTEPIVRIYTEAPSQTEADALADRFIAAFAE
jgi:phosphomannomutase